MDDPVAITLYLPDPSDLPDELERLRDRGFVETDWCELRDGDGRIVTYGPCERWTG